MRRVVLQIITNLSGSVDDPAPRVAALGDDAYAEIDRQYATFDTVLVGTVTYAGMAAYWPAAEHAPGGSEPFQRLAGRMNSYPKVVFSRQAAPSLAPWNNVELVQAPDDDALVAAVQQLKAQPGGDLHLAGGAQLAQTFVRLGLVDRYNFFIHPSAAPGRAWFDQAQRPIWLKLLSANTYSGGFTSSYYEPAA